MKKNARVSRESFQSLLELKVKPCAGRRKWTPQTYGNWHMSLYLLLAAQTEYNNVKWTHDLKEHHQNVAMFVLNNYTSVPEKADQVM